MLFVLDISDTKGLDTKKAQINVCRKVGRNESEQEEKRGTEFQNRETG